MLQIVPWNHFSRKNLGFFYALSQGAEQIWDFDDDNALQNTSIIPWDDIKKRESPISVVSCIDRFFNPNPISGSTNPFAWPRGLPLDRIKYQDNCSVSMLQLPHTRVGVYQSVADTDPDVDAIYRMSQPLPFYFKPVKPRFLALEQGTVSPYNAQATLHTKDALWASLLPMSVNGRVSDIWRSYIAQRLFKEIGLHVAFTPPFVAQVRNPHNYNKDFQAELPLYQQTNELVNVLFVQLVMLSYQYRRVSRRCLCCALRIRLH